ncbi:response regulator [Psychroflexus sp. CAK8W]|uniref:Response regulator n=1 Tax=Psychroflexus longus TaxID=2873596 RepID=A0ABS7XF91_9FLAO|nr:response regulator [Psychroflexus longus]MBZ9777627.1 response regulator [Psychroflexus longus]
MTKTEKALQLLIVEDNFGDYTLVKEYLEEHFEYMTYQHAINYKEAEALLKGEAKFDVIFLDLSLPDLSGKLLVKKVLSIETQTPVIILTGSLNLDLCVESLQLGVSDYLFKDELNPNALFKSINYTIEKQKQRLKILESEKKYSDLFHLSPLPMFVYDVETLKFLDVNSATIELFGYKKEVFLGMSLHQIFFSKDMDSFLGALKQTVHKDSHSFDDYFSYKKKSGEEINAEITIKTIIFQNRKAKLVVAKDVTERLQHYKALASQNEKLKQIAWQQSHEMRSPASKILGIVELLNTGVCSKKEEGVLIKEIGKTVKELDSVIRAITKNTKQIQPSK